MEAIVYIAQSIEGFIADQNGGLEWLTSIPNPSGSDYGFGLFMASIDAVVMGRNTFEKVCGFDSWPYPELFTSRIFGKRKKSLKQFRIKLFQEFSFL